LIAQAITELVDADTQRTVQNRSEGLIDFEWPAQQWLARGSGGVCWVCSGICLGAVIMKFVMAIQGNLTPER
jgi:hypothetical protein